MIDVSVKDFSRWPVGRYRDDSENSGEEFREQFLAQPLVQGETVRVNLDGVAGYPSSFLEEAFAGLVREHGLSQQALDERLVLLAGKAAFQLYVEEIRSYIKAASDKATSGSSPRPVSTQDAGPELDIAL